MNVPIVTAINEAYLPGLIALYNSYKANAGHGFDFYCIVDGDAELFAHVSSLGVKTLKPTPWADVYPVSGDWPEETPSLFARLQIPRLLSDHEKAIWIDADCIIVDSITGLLDYNFSEPVAACRPNDHRYTIGSMCLNSPHGMAEVRAMFTGLIVFNIQEWNDRDITGQCAEAMLDDSITFRWGDQSVLSYVLQGDFFELPMTWQTFAHREDAVIDKAKILHWLGCVPWQTKMLNSEIWERYAA